MRGTSSSHLQSHSYAKSKLFRLPDIKKTSIGTTGRRIFRRGVKSEARRHSPTRTTTQRQSHHRRRPKKVANESKSSVAFSVLLKSTSSTLFSKSLGISS